MSFRRFFFISGILLLAITAKAQNASERDYTFMQCEGSHIPYPYGLQTIETPDSLTPVMINHVGRHGARYPTSPSDCKLLISAINRADSLGTLTPLGRDLKALAENVISKAEDRWGTLDSLGIAEQEEIADRMYRTFPHLLKHAKIEAMSSYVPRCMMSMYAFTHKLDRIDDKIKFYTSTGSQNDSLLRPFQINKEYLALRESGKLSHAAKKYVSEHCPLSAIERVLGNGYQYDGGNDHMRKLAMAEYSVLSSLQAMGMQPQAEKFFTIDEYRALWECANLEQYFMRTATTVSQVPAEITSALVRDIVSTADAYLSGTSDAAVVLRFGHAETLMPLLSQLRLPGCYYITDDPATVASHWRNFYVVPMAANLQFIFFKTSEGKVYVRTELNETPVPLIEGENDIYVPWAKAREYMLSRASQ